jgi:hypothetical protein
LYAIALGWPGVEMTLGFVKVKKEQPSATISLLGDRQRLAYHVNDQGQPVLDLRGVQVDDLQGSHAFAFRLEGFELGLHEQAYFALPGSITLLPAKVTLQGPKIRTQENEGRENIGFWDDAGAKAHWLVNVERPGAWLIRGEFSCASGPSHLELSLAGERVEAKIPRTNGWFKPEWIEFGRVTIERPGVYHMTLAPNRAEAWKPVNVYQLQLALIDD